MNRFYPWLHSAVISLLFPLLSIPAYGLLMLVCKDGLDVRSLAGYGMFMVLYSCFFNEISTPFNAMQAVSFGSSRKNAWKGILLGSYLPAPLVLVINTAAAGFLFPEAAIYHLVLANLGCCLGICGCCGLVAVLGMKLQGGARKMTLLGGVMLAIAHMVLLQIMFDIPALMWGVLAEGCVMTVIFAVVSRKVLLNLEVKI